jgi:hypothetical protein
MYDIYHDMSSSTSKSIIFKHDSVSFKSIVASSQTLAEIIRKLGMKASGNYKTLKRRLEKENIDISHIKLGLNTNKGRKLQPTNIIPLKDIFCMDSKYYGGGRGLKNHVFKEKLLENKCNICALGPEWQGKPISLQIDHINGIHNDNRIENLRILCPNCHSQTDTFSGKNQKKNW